MQAIHQRWLESWRPGGRGPASPPPSPPRPPRVLDAAVWADWSREAAVRGRAVPAPLLLREEDAITHIVRPLPGPVTPAADWLGEARVQVSERRGRGAGSGVACQGVSKEKK